jgi:hypothetical protein
MKGSKGVNSRCFMLRFEGIKQQNFAFEFFVFFSEFDNRIKPVGYFTGFISFMVLDCRVSTRGVLRGYAATLGCLNDA